MLADRKVPAATAMAMLDVLVRLVQIMDAAFEATARERIHHRDEDGGSVLAAVLMPDCQIWIEDTGFIALLRQQLFVYRDRWHFLDHPFEGPGPTRKRRHRRYWRHRTRQSRTPDLN
ncbi:MAG: hypothetical protein LC114_12255, partial [Bryobacterales bacterium]|nr:hypothetical protein [Bryobacterales bacterium]